MAALRDPRCRALRDPAPSLEHQIISARLFAHLIKYLEPRPGGLLLYAPLDVILADRPDETSIVQPDILYMRPIGWPHQPAWDGGRADARRRDPLAVYAQDRSRDETRLYARYGVPFLWLVDPTRGPSKRSPRGHSLCARRRRRPAPSRRSPTLHRPRSGARRALARLIRGSDGLRRAGARAAARRRTSSRCRASRRSR